LEVDATTPERLIPPFLHGTADRESSLQFLYHNTSKKSITLDFNSAQGQQRAMQLLTHCDLLLDSLPPGTLDGLNLPVSRLLGGNPALVVTSISGFGQSGPHCGFKTSDIVASALAGGMAVTGFPEDPPVRLVGSQSHVMASTMAAASSMIALYHSRETGRGQHVDISMQETMLAVTSICGVGKWLED
ncbi:MAG: hypothetical protein GY888_05330, partial [Planctomycetaceae bacterium]|nr:hypothetical protein [Planctomycetaceae bacterium]